MTNVTSTSTSTSKDLNFNLTLKYGIKALLGGMLATNMPERIEYTKGDGAKGIYTYYAPTKETQQLMNELDTYFLENVTPEMLHEKNDTFSVEVYDKAITAMLKAIKTPSKRKQNMTPLEGGKLQNEEGKIFQRAIVMHYEHLSDATTPKKEVKSRELTLCKNYIRKNYQASSLNR